MEWQKGPCRCGLIYPCIWSSFCRSSQTVLGASWQVKWQMILLIIQKKRRWSRKGQRVQSYCRDSNWAGQSQGERCSHRLSINLPYLQKSSGSLQLRMLLTRQLLTKARSCWYFAACRLEKSNWLTKNSTDVLVKIQSFQTSWKLGADFTLSRSCRMSGVVLLRRQYRPLASLQEMTISQRKFSDLSTILQLGSLSLPQGQFTSIRMCCCRYQVLISSFCIVVFSPIATRLRREAQVYRTGSSQFYCSIVRSRSIHVYFRLALVFARSQPESSSTAFSRQLVALQYVSNSQSFQRLLMRLWLSLGHSIALLTT